MDRESGVSMTDLQFAELLETGQKELAEARIATLCHQMAARSLELFAEGVDKLTIETTSGETRLGAEAMRREVIRAARQFAATVRQQVEE
jgi:hypothetical protein